MTVFLNGRFLPEDQAVVSAFDRGFLYGDGLFETIRIHNRQPFRWSQHLQRLQRGADFLRLQIPFPIEALRQFAVDLIAQNQLPDALLRLTLSRGVGPRGYSPKDARTPTIVMSLHGVPGTSPAEPIGWKVMTSSIRVPADDPLAQFKTGNKLPQILARAEADDAGADEAILVNTKGDAIEGTASNLFWIEKEAVCTPPVASGILPGITRAVILEICKSMNLTVREISICPEDLEQADALFFTLTSLGLAEARSLNGHSFDPSPIIARLYHAYRDALTGETR